MTESACRVMLTRTHAHMPTLVDEQGKTYRVRIACSPLARKVLFQAVDPETEIVRASYEVGEDVLARVRFQYSMDALYADVMRNLLTKLGGQADA